MSSEGVILRLDRRTSWTGDPPIGSEDDGSGVEP